MSYIEDSDLLLSTQPEPHAIENVELLGEQMGRSFDSIYRDTMATATNVTYANGTALTDILTVVERNDVDRAYRDLSGRNAIKFTPMVPAGQKVGTSPIMPAYWGMCHEDVAFDLRHMDGFVLVSEYASEGGVLLGEFGSDKNGVRFLASSKGYISTGGGAAATDVKNTASVANVYGVFVVGRDAIGGVNLDGQGNGIFRSGDQVTVADPLGWRKTIGWRKYDARAVLNQAFMQEIACAASL